MVTLRTAITNLNNIRTQLTTSKECIITYKDLSLMRVIYNHLKEDNTLTIELNNNTIIFKRNE